MKTLHFLLKLFPKSFQKTMGEAWVEASEMEIRERQKSTGKNVQVLMAFALETLFNVLPKAYNIGEEDTPNVADFVPTSSVVITQTINFLTIVFISFLMAFALTIHWLVASSVENPYIFWSFAITVTVLIVYMMFLLYFSKSQWLKNKIQWVGRVVGAATGVFAALVLMTQMMLFVTMGNMSHNFVAYDSLTEEMGIREENNQWFKDGMLRSEKKDLWCATNRVRIETIMDTFVASEDNLAMGFLMSAASASVYTRGCWDNDANYIAHQHRITAKSLNTPLIEKMFASFDGVFVWKILNYHRATAVKNAMYTPQRHCVIYMSHYNLNNEKLVKNFCSQFSKTTFVSAQEAKNVRILSDAFVQGKSVNQQWGIQ